MKYVNAAEILPGELLSEIQKYVDGKTLYVPSVQKTASWGEKSGARSFLQNATVELRRVLQRAAVLRRLPMNFRSPATRCAKSFIKNSRSHKIWFRLFI